MSYDNTLIARGLKVYVGIDAHDDMVPDLLAGRVTIQQVLSLLDGGGVGVWWGIMGQFGDIEDFEDYAYSDDMLADTYEDLEGGDVSIVLIGKRPTRNGEPWDPEWHNPPEAGGLMGNSYLDPGEPVELVEVRYNAGKGWKSLPARGLRTKAQMEVTSAIVQHQQGTPLNYGGKFPGRPERLYLTEPGYEGRHTTGNWEGTPNDVVAYLDYSVVGQQVYIWFMTTREDREGQGLAGRLVADLYRRTTGEVEWGELMDAGAEVLYKRFLKSHSERTGGGKVWGQWLTGPPPPSPEMQEMLRKIRGEASRGDVDIEVKPSGPLQLGDWTVVARINGEIVGRLSGGKYNAVEKVFVAPEHRRKGIATKMFRALLEREPSMRMPDEFTDSGAAWFSKINPEGREYSSTWGTDPNWSAWMRQAYKIAARKMTWDQVKAQYPVYSAWGMDHAVNELAHILDGEMVTPDLVYTEEMVDLREVRFQRYPETDQRMKSLLEAYNAGRPVPPPLLVKRAGELHTVDGHHRLSAREARGETLVPAVIAHSLRKERYSGAASIGHTSRNASKTALPSWRDRGVMPERAEAIIAPDLGRGRRNSYMVYLYGQPHARRVSLAEAKATVEDIYGDLEWEKVPGDQMPHHDPVHGQTTMFNDAPYYLVVRRLPRLGVDGSVLAEGGQEGPGGVLAMGQQSDRAWLSAHASSRQEEQGSGDQGGLQVGGGAARLGATASTATYYHVSGVSNRSSIEQHGLRGGDHGVWLYSDPEKVRGIDKVWTPGHPFEEQDVWLVEATDVIHGTQAHDQTSAGEWGPADPVWVTYTDVPPERVHRVDNHTLRTASTERVRYHVEDPEWERLTPLVMRTAAAAALDSWRPTKGMFARGQDTLDPRVFDTQTEHMLPAVHDAVLDALDAYWTPKYGDWRAWAKVYLAGSGASYWWDSDADMDILIGVDLDRLREARPANKEVADGEIVAHLNRGLKEDLRPTTTEFLGLFEATWFINAGAYDITAIHPYAAYDITADAWVVKPPVLPANWGPSSIPESIWRRVEQTIRSAQQVLALPEPERTVAGTVFFNWIHEERRASYSAYGGGWLSFGNVCYQALSQHPDHLLRMLYLCKHPEEETAADSIEVTAVHALPSHTPGDRHFLGAIRMDDLPKPLGETPIPSGTIRCYHYTGEDDAESIARSGLLTRYARGDGGMGYGNEPSAGIWAATGRPATTEGMKGAKDGQAIIEFWIKPEQISQQAEYPPSGTNPVSWGQGYHHIILRGDLSPNQIVAIHLPWHRHARYLLENYRTTWRKEFGDEIDSLGEDYRKAFEWLGKHASIPSS